MKLHYNIFSELTTKHKCDIYRLIKDQGVSLLQNPEWVYLTQTQRKKYYIITYNDSDELVGFSIITVKFWHGIIWFGPICRDEDLLPEFILNTAQLAKTTNIALLSIVDRFSDKSYCSINASVSTSFRFSVKQSVAPWATSIIDLTCSEKLLFSKFSSNHKRAVKKALDKGMLVRQIESETEILLFAQIYEKMYQRRNILPSSSDTKKMFLKLFVLLKQNQLGSFWGIFYENLLLGGVIVGYHGKTAFYHFGASDKLSNNFPVMHMLFYEVMLWLKRNNFSQFDLGGYDIINKDKQLANINRFKDGFGGEIIHYPQPINIILIKSKYFIVIKLKPLLRYFIKKFAKIS